jgi:hypothetical protein
MAPTKDVPWELIAAWATASIALLAFGASLWTGWEARVQARAAADQLELERKPVLILTGQSAFLIQERAHNVPPPSRVLFIKPGFNRLAAFDSKIPMMNKHGLLYELPPLYARFRVINGGRLPVVRVHIPVTIFFYLQESPHDLGNFQQEQTAIDIPLLVPGETFDFAVANASTLNVRYEFRRKASLTRVDTEKVDEITLFADDGVANNEHQIINRAR